MNESFIQSFNQYLFAVRTSQMLQQAR